MASDLTRWWNYADNSEINVEPFNEYSNGDLPEENTHTAFTFLLMVEKNLSHVNEDVRVISLLIIFFLKTINVMHTDFSQEQKDLFGIIVFMAFVAEKRVTTVFTYCWKWISSWWLW